MKKRALIIGGAALLLVIIIVASVRSGETKGEKVYVEAAKTRAIESVVTAPGQIDPKVKVNISAHVIGKIEQLYFQEGDVVRRGQKLVELEKQAFTAQRDRARAELANRRIEVQRARSSMRSAEIAYRRAQSLQTQGIQAQELLERAEVDLSNARAGSASAEEGVRQSQASLIQAQDDLSRTTILAPIDGKVVELNAQKGEVVITGTMNNPGSSIAVIADLSQILVEAEVGETEVVAIRTGQAARVTVEAIAAKEYRAHVVEIGSSASSRQGTTAGLRYFKVKAAIDDPDERLRPGMTAQVSIVTSTATNTVAIPIQCVLERVPGAKKGDEEDDDAQKRMYVFFAREGKAKMIEVTTGISDATYVAIVSGTKAGDPVITGPFRTLKKLYDGDAVTVTDEKKQEEPAKKDKE
ncbi:MAG: efflux RND transporter periplasmic adaptor subunit [Thermoanaerobaculia bacterium]|nr:efflux RND transporter periplasmic adaptor subunit [Thermoanaerobaculia bacterium]